MAVDYLAVVRFEPLADGVEELITDVELEINRELLPACFIDWLDADPRHERQLVDLLARDALRRHCVRGLDVVHLSRADTN